MQQKRLGHLHADNQVMCLQSRNAILNCLQWLIPQYCHHYQHLQYRIHRMSLPLELWRIDSSKYCHPLVARRRSVDLHFLPLSIPGDWLEHRHVQRFQPRFGFESDHPHAHQLQVTIQSARIVSWQVRRHRNHER